MLIERGAGVSAQDKDGQTPLHQASKEGELEVACMLVERGADVSDHWPAHLTCIQIRWTSSLSISRTTCDALLS